MSRTLVSTGPRLGAVVKIVLESGAVNAAYLLAYLIVLQSGSHGLEIMASIVRPNPNLIEEAQTDDYCLSSPLR